MYSKFQPGVCGCGKPDIDSDGDGVLDCKDAFPNDPNEWIDTDNDKIGDNADTDDDGDGMPDAWEVKYGLRPLVNDAGEDPDNDGLTNAEEYAARTNPRNPDSDGDGMPDGWEVTYGLDPLANDAPGDKDGDGYTNWKEYKARKNPADPASKPAAMSWLPLLLDD